MQESKLSRPETPILINEDNQSEAGRNEKQTYTDDNDLSDNCNNDYFDDDNGGNDYSGGVDNADVDDNAADVDDDADADGGGGGDDDDDDGE